MRQRIEQVREEALKDIAAATTAEELEQVKIRYLARKGLVSALLAGIKDVGPAERPEAGRLANELKVLLTDKIDRRAAEISSVREDQPQVDIDVTMPGQERAIGHTHPISSTIQEICNVFSHMGFAVVEGPEIEIEHNNFEALNIPTDHPSREAFDTFYIKDEWLLRSHTSPVQVRYMQDNKPPLAIVVPGKVYRPDAVDASHSFMFHQIEGLMVSDNISFANLKWLLFEFARQYFGPTSRVRFRPHFFPFTEPSAEVDVSCMICNGQGCRVCSNKGWLEILGAGMVDPNVFKAVGIDSQQYSGLAFGMGVERIAMLKYGIDDIRLFYENDLRFLRQF